MLDHYKTLQIDQRASHEVTKAAYRALVKVHQGNEKKLRELNAADEILGDDSDKTSTGKTASDSKSK